MKYWHGGLLILILAVGLALRWTGLDWDGYHHYHPDERYITWVATTIEWPNDWSVALQPAESTFNPFYWPPEAESEGIAVLQDQPRNFAYGHVPLYGGVVATRLVERLSPLLLTILPSDWLLARDVANGIEAVEFRHLTVVSRALTGLIDVGTILLVFLLGKRLYETAVGLIAAAFLAVNVMHIQLAHFFISDPYMTFFVVAAIYLLVVALGQRGSVAGGRWLVWGAAACVGLAVGSKFAAVLLLLPLTLVVWFLWQEQFIRGMITAVFITFLTFFITNPFAILDLNCELLTPPVQLGSFIIPEINWRSCYLDNIILQGNMVRGNLVAPFTYQYDGTLPYLYYIEMQLKVGMGPLLGLAAFVGFAWVVLLALRTAWQILQQRDWYARHIAHNAKLHLIPLAFLLPFFLSTGNFFVKFMRYLQPMTPFLMIYGAALLWQIRQKQVRSAVVGAVVGLTAVYAFAFTTIYQQEHPWTAASKWVYENVEPGTLILSEQWDDSLPTSLLLPDGPRSRNEYPNAELTWLTRGFASDNGGKLNANLALLAEAEYLTLMSNRVYGVVPRAIGIPKGSDLTEPLIRYPISRQYHQLLLDGKLGYEVVAINGRFPTLGSLSLQPDTFSWPGLQPPDDIQQYLDATPSLNWGRLDESFTVYDQPLTIIFKNTGQLSAAEMRKLFELQ